MDPLIANGVDPALLRVLERHGREQDSAMRRRRSPAPPAQEKTESETDPESPKHELDDLA